VRDSVTEAIAEVPGTCLKPGMQTVVETLVKDIARDLITVSEPDQNHKKEGSVQPRCVPTMLRFSRDQTVHTQTK